MILRLKVTNTDLHDQNREEKKFAEYICVRTATEHREASSDYFALAPQGCQPT